MNRIDRLIAAALISSLISPIVCQAEITVSLSKGFVKKYKDKATVATTFRVDKSHDEANPVGTGSDDGDIHVAGRDSVVKLPMVAEIINGKKENDTLDFLLQGLGQEFPVIGTWRFWFEHPGHEDQLQGNPVPPAANTNPDHVFELHPLVQFGNFDCRDSFVPIKDGSKEFRGYPAAKAFGSYEKRPVLITRSNTAIMITSNKAVYNYAEFEMRLAGKPKEVTDGYIVFANVYAAGAAADAEPIFESPRRMVFVKGTPPADAVKGSKKGDKLHVLGIPRVNLNQVYAIATALAADEEYSAGWSSADACAEDNPCLPYEMIIVAILS